MRNKSIRSKSVKNVSANVNKSGFQTEICTFYYLWEKKNGEECLLFLGSSQRAFEEYCKDICNGIENITWKRLPKLEGEVKRYLEGRLKDFGFKVRFLKGTEFEIKVWEKTRSIPYGKTVSYKEISKLIGHPNSWRAVGNALAKNPIMLVIPCHRILKNGGNIGGFSAGIDIKKTLLEIEKRYK